MRLTNEMRKDIAAVLTGNATQKEGLAIIKQCEILNAKFWEIFEKRVADFTGIPAHNWGKLITAGSCRGTASAFAYVAETNDKGEKVTRRAFVIGRPQDEWSRDVLQNLSAGAVRNGFSKFLKHDWRKSGVCLVFTAPKTMVSMTTADEFTPSHPVAKRIAKLQNRVAKFETRAKTLRAELDQILAGCNTAAQLVEALPEAEPYIPKPAPKKEVVPTELRETVRAKLKTGVPGA